MNNFNLKASVLLVSTLCLTAAYSATMNKTDYSAGKSRISAEYKADKARCDSLSGNAKDVCALEAKGKEKVALAELEAGYTGKATDQNKVIVAKAKAAYDVAKEKCDDLAGNQKDVCVKEAKAMETRALADAKMASKIRDARVDATADKRDAEYAAAREKCDAMAGNAKESCLATAKSKFGKS